MLMLKQIWPTPSPRVKYSVFRTTTFFFHRGVLRQEVAQLLMPGAKSAERQMQLQEEVLLQQRVQQLGLQLPDGQAQASSAEPQQVQLQQEVLPLGQQAQASFAEPQQMQLHAGGVAAADGPSWAAAANAGSTACRERGLAATPPLDALSAATAPAAPAPALPKNAVSLAAGPRDIVAIREPYRRPSRPVFQQSHACLVSCGFVGSHLACKAVRHSRAIPCAALLVPQPRGGREGGNGGR